MALHLADEYVQQKANEKATNELVSTLQMMGYGREYVLRAIQVHKKSKFGSNYNVSLLVEIIMRLKEKETSTNIFLPHFMTIDEPLGLKINDTIDYRFENGRFILCRIVEKKLNYNNETIVKLHPLGRPISDTKYDKYCNINLEYTKLAIAKSVSLRKIKSSKHIFYNLKIDDYIDINPIYRIGHEGWKSGRIIKIDPNSSQIKVLYHNGRDNKNYSYWIHLQNIDEVSEFRSRCKGVDQHQLQAEFENLEEEFSRLQRQSIVDMSNIRYSVLNRAEVPQIHNKYRNNNINNISNYKPYNPYMNKPISNIKYEKWTDNTNNIKPPKEISNMVKQIKPRAIPKIIKDDFNNQISSVALGNNILLDDIVNDMAGNNNNNNDDEYITPMGQDDNNIETVTETPVIDNNTKQYNPLMDNNNNKYNYKKENEMSEFNNNIGSLALGNNILMDDIIGEMDGGINETFDETPMGPNSDSDDNDDKQLPRQPLHLMSSNSEEIEYGNVKANDCKNVINKMEPVMEYNNNNKQKPMNTMIKIMDDLERIGYPKKNIINAMNNVNDKTDINEIINYLDTCSDNNSDNNIIDEEPTNINNYIDNDEKKDIYMYNNNDNEEYVSEYKECMSMDEINNLNEGDKIDHRNIFGKFCRATIICKNEEKNELQIQYNGWTHQYIMDGIWNGWCKINKNTQCKFAKYKSISYRKLHEWKFKYLRIGSLVELKPMKQLYHKINDWQCAEIFKIDNKYGQIQCKYKYNNNIYLYWVHFDNISEIIYIDNFYDIGDNICVYNNKKKKWMIAKIYNIKMNYISIDYIENNNIINQNEIIHVCFDYEKLIFPKLKKDIKYIENAIIKEKLKWKLIKVTPTNNTIYQCFAYMIYGDLNQAINVKNECIRYIRYNKDKLKLNINNNNNNNNNDDELNIIALCCIYKVRIRVIKYNIKKNGLDIVFDRGIDDLNVPIILLSKHLNKYYNIIIDMDSLDRIPFYYH